MKRLCFVGPMLSSSGNVRTQGEVLADLLGSDGYKVFRKSTYKNRILRFFDTVFFLSFSYRNYDCVIIQVYGGLSFVLEDIASFIAKRHNKQIIMTLHGGALPDFFGHRKKWAKLVLGRADHITCPSRYLVDQLSFLGLELVEIPNVINLSDYTFKERYAFRPLIFWMRAYHEIYDPLLALEVFECLCLKYPDAKITMAGPDMGLLKEVKRVVSLSRHKDRIFVLGKIDLSMKQSIADNHDMYLNTNSIDNTPVSMLEMAVLGLPLISTNVGGIPYLFKHNSSALLTERSSTALCNNLIQVVENPELGRNLVSEAKIIASHFDWNEVRSKWLRIL